MVAGGTGSGARGPGAARAQHSARAEAARNAAGQRQAAVQGWGQARNESQTRLLRTLWAGSPWKTTDSTQRCVYNTDGLREAAGLGHTAS